MLIGAHVSPAGGLYRAAERGAELGARSIQIFNQSPRMWRPTAHGPDDYERFRAAAGGTIEAALIHAVYLLNCASEDEEIVVKTHASLVQSLTVGAGIGASVVLHPGSALKGDPLAAVERAGRVIAEALAETGSGGTGRAGGSDAGDGPDGGGGKRSPAELHLENTAGAGGTLGRSFEELAALIEAAGGDQRLGVCLDSCHLLASGYDIRTAAGLSEVLDEFDRIVGIGRLRSLHANDSKMPLGSNRDRHDDLGKGELGEEGCAVFLSEPRFEGLPCVLETPGADGRGPSVEDMAHAFALRERGLAARSG